MASATLPTPNPSDASSVDNAVVIVASPMPPRSPWAFGGPFSHEGPVPAVTDSATLGDLDVLGRL